MKTTSEYLWRNKIYLLNSKTNGCFIFVFANRFIYFDDYYAVCIKLRRSILTHPVSRVSGTQHVIYVRWAPRAKWGRSSTGRQIRKVSRGNHETWILGLPIKMTKSRNFLFALPSLSSVKTYFCRFQSRSCAILLNFFRTPIVQS